MAQPGSTFHRRVSVALGALGARIYDRPWGVLIATLLIVGALASQIGNLYFETRVEEFLEADDPVRVQYDVFRDQFGRDELIVVALKPPEIFSFDFLSRLRDLHIDLEDNLPYLDEITSLYNARQTRAVGDELITDDFLQDWPESQADLDALREAALDNPFYINSFISANGSTTGMVLRLQTYNLEGQEEGALGGFSDTGEETPEFLLSGQVAELISELDATLARHPFPDTVIAVAGNPIVATKLQRFIGADMVRFSSLAILLIGALLFAVFRRLSGVLLPLLCVVLAQVATLGAMGLSGGYIDTVNQMIPSFLLAVGVGYSVHIIAIAFQSLDQGLDQRAAIVRALEHSGPAVVMAGLTTMGGMASFAASEITSVKFIGVFVPLGVLFSVLLALLFVPAALALLPIRVRPEKISSGSSPTETFLAACGRFGVRHPVSVVLVSLAIVAVFSLGGVWLSGEYDPLDWLPANDQLRIDTHFIDRELGGATNIEIVANTGKENGLHDPAVLRRLEAMEDHLLRTSHPDFSMVKSTSVVEVSKEVHRALNEGRKSFYIIPDDPILLAQELLLFETSGTDDLEKLVDSSFQQARLSIKGQWAGSSAYSEYIDAQTPRLQELSEGTDFYISGLFYVVTRFVRLIRETAVASYSIAFLLVTPLMILFIGSLRIGLVSMIPNLAPIAMVIGIMGWFSISLDFFTLLIAGIALALVVDDTIHILNGFRRDFADCGNVEEAVVRTMRTTGRALLFTTLALTAGFSLFASSQLLTVKTFGYLTALVVFLAFVLDLFLSPALLALVYRSKEVSQVDGH